LVPVPVRLAVPPMFAAYTIASSIAVRNTFWGKKVSKSLNSK